MAKAPPPPPPPPKPKSRRQNLREKLAKARKAGGGVLVTSGGITATGKVSVGGQPVIIPEPKVRQPTAAEKRAEETRLLNTQRQIAKQRIGVITRIETDPFTGERTFIGARDRKFTFPEGGTKFSGATSFGGIVSLEQPAIPRQQVIRRERSLEQIRLDAKRTGEDIIFGLGKKTGFDVKKVDEGFQFTRLPVSDRKIFGGVDVKKQKDVDNIFIRGSTFRTGEVINRIPDISELQISDSLSGRPINNIPGSFNVLLDPKIAKQTRERLQKATFQQTALPTRIEPRPISPFFEKQRQRIIRDRELLLTKQAKGETLNPFEQSALFGSRIIQGGIETAQFGQVLVERPELVKAGLFLARESIKSGDVTVTVVPEAFRAGRLREDPSGALGSVFGEIALFRGTTKVTSAALKSPSKVQSFVFERRIAKGTRDITGSPWEPPKVIFESQGRGLANIRGKIKPVIEVQEVSKTRGFIPIVEQRTGAVLPQRQLQLIPRDVDILEQFTRPVLSERRILKPSTNLFNFPETRQFGIRKSLTPKPLSKSRLATLEADFFRDTKTFATPKPFKTFKAKKETQLGLDFFETKPLEKRARPLLEYKPPAPTRPLGGRRTLRDLFSSKAGEIGVSRTIPKSDPFGETFRTSSRIGTKGKIRFKARGTTSFDNFGTIFEPGSSSRFFTGGGQFFTTFTGIRGGQRRREDDISIGISNNIAASFSSRRVKQFDINDITQAFKPKTSQAQTPSIIQTPRQKQRQQTIPILPFPSPPNIEIYNPFDPRRPRPRRPKDPDPRVPPPDFEINIRGRKRKKKQKDSTLGRRRLQFQPSLIGIDERIIGRQPTVATGLKVRPITLTY